MKVYSIGREVGCDIVINDRTDVISRRHATLNVTSSGKMTIIDQSHNGTYVNGIRISPNVPVPVTRKDNVSFAHIARLDWNMVPKPTSPVMYAAMALIALLLVAGGVAGYHYMGGTPGTSTQNSVAADSATIKKQEQEDADSVKTAEEQKKIRKPAKDAAPKKQPAKEKVCPTCKKKISSCDYQGKHPKEPKKCATCGKELKDCEYGGKHPAKKLPRSDR